MEIYYGVMQAPFGTKRYALYVPTHEIILYSDDPEFFGIHSLSESSADIREFNQVAHSKRNLSLPDDVVKELIEAGRNLITAREKYTEKRLPLTRIIREADSLATRSS